MAEAIMDVDALSIHLKSRFYNRKLRIRETEESVIIFPVQETAAANLALCGMFEGTGLSTEAFMKQKQSEKALEL
ncbi:MAG: hypothetical protein LBS85_01730 [Clostridiales Family XIII bacterium]|nr:hypothetical protein [Clostridiales Family XIII bacterium]